MKLQLVSKEQAVRLKDIGFPQDKHDLGYTICKCSDRFNVYEKGILTENASSMIKKVSAPSLELVAKWLREEKNIDIDISVDSHGFNYPRSYAGCIIDRNTLEGPNSKRHYLSQWDYEVKLGFHEGKKNPGSGCHSYDKYEDCLSDGIDLALKLLENEISENNKSN